MKSLRMASLVIVFTLTATAAFASEGGRRPHHGPRGLPPELKEQLTAEQITQLEAATSREAKKALLDSWGIQMPERKGPPPKGGRPPGPPLDDETKAKIDALKASYDSATTDTEREEIREQMREVFKAARDADRGAIRKFFKEDHSRFPPPAESTGRESVASAAGKM